MEVRSDTSDQEQSLEADVAGTLAGIRQRKMSPIEWAALQAAESRRQRLDAEAEQKKFQQREDESS